MANKIEDRIRKLLRLAADNANVNEAANAFAAAQELATRHALDLDNLTDVSEEVEPPREVENIEDRWIEQWGKAVPWKLTIAGAVARANGCDEYYLSGSTGRHPLLRAALRPRHDGLHLSRHHQGG